MGEVVCFSRRSLHHPDVFSPVNYRPTELCRTLIFDPTDGNHYAERYDAVAVQYASGERLSVGFHIIETPDFDGPVLRYTTTRPDGSISVALRRGDPAHVTHSAGDVRFVGLVFQFIRNLETGERWELIRGPAYEGDGERLESRPLYEATN